MMRSSMRLDAEVVLERNRHAGEWPERRAGRALLIDQRGPRDGALGDHVVEGVERGIGLIDSGERRTRDLDRGCLAGDDRFPDLPSCRERVIR